MIEPLAYCPQCKNNVAFLTKGQVRECPVYGFQFDLADAPSTAEPRSSAGHAAMSVLRGLLWTLAVMAGLLAVGIGLLFASCGLSSGGRIGP